MDNKNYIPRLFDFTLKFSLRSKRGVLVVGPKWCGKSTTCKQYAKTIVDLSDDEKKEQYIELSKISPKSLLNIGEKHINR